MATNKCSKCGTPTLHSDCVRNSKSANGYENRCLACARKQWTARDAADPQAHYARTWRSQLWRKFRMLPEEYEQRVTTQQARCMICGKPETKEQRGRVIRLAVDHDHETGKTRDLLCYRCNLMIGHALESPTTLRAAADYLERHS